MYSIERKNKRRRIGGYITNKNNDKVKKEKKIDLGKNLDDDSDSDEEENLSSKDSTENFIKVKNNRILFHADVTRKTCIDLITALDKASKFVNKYYTIDSKKPSIMLHINSDGGEVYSALSVIEHMKHLDAHITTICEGCVASAGVLISLAGNRKIIRKHSYMMIHEIRSGCWGKYSECQDDMKNNKKLMKDLKKYMQEACNGKLPEDSLDELLRHDIMWSARKCVKYGLVDEIR
jgi:ATP-dependent Clp endopeptidase proteolytic subunit ClpP